MNASRSLFAALVLLAPLSLVTAACEVKVNNPDNPPPTQPATATPTPAPPPPPAPAPPVSR